MEPWWSHSDPWNVLHDASVRRHSPLPPKPLKPSNTPPPPNLYPLVHADGLSWLRPCRLAQPRPPPLLSVPSPLRRWATRSWRWTAATSSASPTTKPCGSSSRRATWWWRWRTWAACRTPARWWARPAGSPARRSPRARPIAAQQGEPLSLHTQHDPSQGQRVNAAVLEELFL